MNILFKVDEFKFIKINVELRHSNMFLGNIILKN
jgi:hypothetical protein